MRKHKEGREEQGFTLIELLIAIVVVGILTAVAIVGIASLTNQGEDSACAATADAAKASQAVHYANNNGFYPTNVAVLVDAGELELSGGARVVDEVNADGEANDDIQGSGWMMDGTTGDTNAPLVFTCPGSTTPPTT